MSKIIALRNDSPNAVPFPETRCPVLPQDWEGYQEGKYQPRPGESLRAWAERQEPAGRPPPGTLSGVPPHVMRPWERIYLEDAGPRGILPPPFSDPRWTIVRKWLWRTMPGTEVLPQFDSFLKDIWTDGPEDGISIGNYSRNYFRYYPHARDSWGQYLPAVRIPGYSPWGERQSNGHYAQALWCLENYLVTRDLRAWRQFVKMVLHQTGQGFYWGPLENVTGDGFGYRYEKSRDEWIGSSYPEGKSEWSHSWPEALWLFSVLTGELEEESREIKERVLAKHPRGYNGYWGPRSSAWAVRALRLLDMSGDARGGSAVLWNFRRTMDLIEGRGIDYLPNLGHSQQENAPWQDGLYASEILQFAAGTAAWDEIYGRLRPLLRFHMEHSRMQSSGWMAYALRDPDGAKVAVFPHGMMHTSFWLPAMAAMVAMGDLPQLDFFKSILSVCQGIPSASNGMRGIRFVTQDGNHRLDWGPGSPKACGMVMFGMRRDILKTFGGF